MGAVLRNGIRLAAGVSAVLLTLTTGIGPPVATAAPGDGGAAADAPVLSLESLGGAANLAFSGAQSKQTVTIPVPPGLIPDAINAVVEIPPSVQAGRISVEQNDRLVSRVELPPTDQAPISIPLAGAEIADNAVSVTLRTQLIAPVGYCLADSDAPMRLINPAVAFVGREAPIRTVAAFLPPILQQLTVFVPAKPSLAESDAALSLATAIVARYGTQQLDVALAALPPGAGVPPEGSGPLQRQIVVRQGPSAGVSLQGDGDVPNLLVTGTGEELTNEARLLTADLSRLAMSTKAVAGPLRLSPKLPADTATIRELGQNGASAIAFKPQVGIALDQTRLGRPVQAMRVQLKGFYTPLPDSVGAQLVVTVGGQVIDRWPVQADGVIDRGIDVPDDVQQRSNNLIVSMEIAGNAGACGQFAPVTLNIDGATTIESSAADPPVPAGFQSMPQALMPKAQVGIGSDAFADTARALTVMKGLQRLSPFPLETEVVPLQQAIESDEPAVLIAANGWTNGRIKLPVGSAPDGTLEVQNIGDDGDATTLRLDPGQRLSSVQTVRDGSRSVLVATSSESAAQLDSLLGWFDEDRQRWSQLSGVAVVAVADQPPVVVKPAESTAEPVASAPADGDHRLWWIAAGVGAVAAVLFVGLLVLVLRRRRPQPSSTTRK